MLELKYLSYIIIQEDIKPVHEKDSRNIKNKNHTILCEYGAHSTSLWPSLVSFLIKHITNKTCKTNQKTNAFTNFNSLLFSFKFTFISH